MTATLIKLAFAGIRSRALASALTILLSGAAAATIVLALEVGATAQDPWQRTFDAANGAHVIATVPSEADARRIGALPGIAERDRPVLPAATAQPRPQGPPRPAPQGDPAGRRDRVTGAAVVFALSMEASLDAQTAGEASDVPDELPVLVYTLDAVLLLITAATLVAVALLSVRERIRDYSVLKTIGLTPRQIASSLVSAHAALALIAALLSIPAGIYLYVAVYGIAGGSSEDRVLAPWWWLALVPIGTVLMVVAATSLPARLATRIPTADALRYE